MKIYAHEIFDGIADKIVENSTVACLSVANQTAKPEDFKPLENALAFEHASDLFYLESVLVSTGWNNNDDVFLSAELWASKNTPEDKQFNFMHDEKDIIGHITGNYVADPNNQRIDGSTDNVPEDFNIVTSAVLYTSWSDPALAERMEKLVAGIKNGEWFVSMECLFPNFDYQLKNVSNGEIVNIERSEATAYLSKHLRAFGGDGVYEGYKVGRVLRNLTFSGKGLVNKPANPKSVILSTAGEIDMSVDLTKELESVKAELAEAKATIESLSPFKGEAETLQVSLAELKTQNSSLQSDLDSTKATLAETVASRDAALSAVAKMEKEKKVAMRKGKCAEAGIEDADVEAFESLSDEAFDKIVAVMKKGASKKKMEEEDEVECAKKDAKAQDIAVLVEPQKTQASINDIAKVDDKPLRETVAEWFNDNVLKTLKS